MSPSPSHKINPVEQLSAEVQDHREAQHPVSPLFLNRWSPRAFTERKVSNADLLSILEAAHWAPSSGNQQLRIIIPAVRTDNRTTTISLQKPLLGSCKASN